MELRTRAALEAAQASSADGWCTTDDVCALTQDTPRVEVNRLLYEWHSLGQVETRDVPPRWRLHRPIIITPNEGAPRPRIHVVVDLGNVHDCLKPLLSYAQKGCLTVAAYADLAFTGFGVVPPLRVENVAVFQADTPDKNSADVQIIWDLSRLTQQREGEPLDIFVASKDLGFRRLERLVNAGCGHTLTFTTGWRDLRLHLP